MGQVCQNLKQTAIDCACLNDNQVKTDQNRKKWEKQSNLKLQNVTKSFPKNIQNNNKTERGLITSQQQISQIKLQNNMHLNEQSMMWHQQSQKNQYYKHQNNVTEIKRDKYFQKNQNMQKDDKKFKWENYMMQAQAFSQYEEPDQEKNQLEQFDDNMSDYQSEQIQLQSLTKGNDQRKPVQNTKVHPYTGIGKIIAYFTHPITKKQHSQEGTGSIINSENILTVMHIFIIRGLNEMIKPNKIKFYPEPLKRLKPLTSGIQVQLVYFGNKYFQLNKAKKIKGKEYDCAVLKLPQHFKFQESNVIKCNLKYSLKPFQKSLIRIPSYPSQQDLRIIQFNSLKSPSPITNALCYDEDTLLKQFKNGIVHYNHSTKSGSSGAPLLLKNCNNQYEIIGLHIGSHGTRNCAILLKKCSLKSTIKQLVNKKLVTFKIAQQISKTSKQNYIQISKTNQNQSQHLSKFSLPKNKQDQLKLQFKIFVATLLAILKRRPDRVMIIQAILKNECYDGQRRNLNQFNTKADNFFFDQFGKIVQRMRQIYKVEQQHSIRQTFSYFKVRMQHVKEFLARFKNQNPKKKNDGSLVNQLKKDRMETNFTDNKKNAIQNNKTIAKNQDLKMGHR